jgi:hypothetical protein
MDRYGGFLGTFRMHDFIAVCETEKLREFLPEASRTFARKIRAFYNREALKENTLLSFTRNGREVSFGLMRLVTCSVNGQNGIPQEDFIEYLLENCPDTEGQMGVQG